MESIYLNPSVCANASDSNITRELWLVEDKTRGQIVAFFLLLSLVVGLPWNLLVIVTIVKQRLYTRPTIILLLSLVVIDLLLLVFHLPLAIVVGFQGEYSFGNSDRTRCMVCNFTGYMSQFFGPSSVFTVSLMSIDRFLFIYKPLHYDRYVTKWRTVSALCVAWLIAAVITVPPLAGVAGNITYLRVAAMCNLELTLENDHYPIVVMLVVCLAIVPIIVCNIWVCCIVQRNIRAIYKVRRSTKTSNSKPADYTEFYRRMKKKRNEKEVHLFKVFGALLCASALSWLPLTIVTVLLFFGVAVNASSVAASKVLFYSQATFHPIIETILIKEVRKPLKIIFFSCCNGVKNKLVSNTNSGGHPNTESCAGTSSTCYRHAHDFVDVCRAALLFDRSQHDTNDTKESTSSNTVEHVHVVPCVMQTPS